MRNWFRPSPKALSWPLVAVCLAVVLSITGCAQQRQIASSAQLLQRQIAADAHHRQALKNVVTTLRQRAEYLRQANDETATLDILILSSGGFWGAFGAGLVAAWNEHPDTPMPDFALISGMSTGALLAPFALAMDPQHPAKAEAYYRASSDDWLQQPVHGILPWRAALLNNKGMVQAARKVYNERVVEQLEQAHQQHRQVVVATADLDLGRQSLWSLTSLAAAGGNAAQLQDLMLAATAIPGVLPPVPIGDSLHADGTTVETLIAGTDPWVFTRLAEDWRHHHGNAPMPPIRVWVVVNGQQRIPPATTQPTWPNITKRAVGAVGKAGLLSGLRSLYLTAEVLAMRHDMDMQVRWICVPEWFTIQGDHDALDARVTAQLADLGRDLGGAAPIPWRTQAPGIEAVFVDDSLIEGNHKSPSEQHAQE